MAYLVNIPTDQKTLKSFLSALIADQYSPQAVKNFNIDDFDAEKFTTWLFTNYYVNREAINSLLKYFIVYSAKNK